MQIELALGILLIGILSTIGLFLVLSDVLKVPSYTTAKMMTAMVRRQKRQNKTLDILLNDVCISLGKLLRLNPYKKAKLAADLKIAGIHTTPETYTATTIVKVGIILLLTIPVYLIVPILSPIGIFIAVLVYFKEHGKIDSLIKRKKEEIDWELPRFVFTVEKTVAYDRDVLSLLERYKENAGKAFAEELKITVADMRSGHQESALTRLESRVGSSALSDVVRGLIGTIRGDDTKVYFQTLSIKFSEMQRQQLKAQAIKIPSKVKKLSFALMACFMLTYFAVLIVSVLQSLTQIGRY